MSKSLARVRTALDRAGLAVEILEMEDSTRTAEEAAQAAGLRLAVLFDEADQGLASLAGLFTPVRAVVERTFK